MFGVALKSEVVLIFCLMLPAAICIPTSGKGGKIQSVVGNQTLESDLVDTKPDASTRKLHRENEVTSRKLYEEKESFWWCRYYSSNYYRHDRKSRRDCFESYYIYDSDRKGFQGEESYKYDYDANYEYSHRGRKKNRRRHRNHQKRHWMSPKSRYNYRERRKGGTFYRRPRSYERYNGYYQDQKYKGKYGWDNTYSSKNTKSSKSSKSSLATKKSKSAKGGYMSKKYNHKSKTNRHHRQKTPKSQYNNYEYESEGVYYHYHPGSSERYYGYHQDEKYHAYDTKRESSRYNRKTKKQSDNRMSTKSRGPVRDSKSTKGGYRSPKKDQSSIFHFPAPSPITHERNRGDEKDYKSNQAPLLFNSAAPSQKGRSKSSNNIMTNAPHSSPSHSTISLDSKSTRKKKTPLSREKSVISQSSDSVYSSRGDKDKHPAKSGNRGDKSPIISPPNEFKSSSTPSSIHTESAKSPSPHMENKQSSYPTLSPIEAQNKTCITPKRGSADHDMERTEIDFIYRTVMNSSIVHDEPSTNLLLDAIDETFVSHINVHYHDDCSQNRSLSVRLMPPRSIEENECSLSISAHGLCQVTTKTTIEVAMTNEAKSESSILICDLLRHIEEFYDNIYVANTVSGIIATEFIDSSSTISCPVRSHGESQTGSLRIQEEQAQEDEAAHLLWIMGLACVLTVVAIIIHLCCRRTRSIACTETALYKTMDSPMKYDCEEVDREEPIMTSLIDVHRCTSSTCPVCNGAHGKASPKTVTWHNVACR